MAARHAAIALVTAAAIATAAAAASMTLISTARLPLLLVLRLVAAATGTVHTAVRVLAAITASLNIGAIRLWSGRLVLLRLIVKRLIAGDGRRHLLLLLRWLRVGCLRLVGRLRSELLHLLRLHLLRLHLLRLLNLQSGHSRDQCGLSLDHHGLLLLLIHVKILLLLKLLLL